LIGILALSSAFLREFHHAGGEDLRSRENPTLAGRRRSKKSSRPAALAVLPGLSIFTQSVASGVYLARLLGDDALHISLAEDADQVRAAPDGLNIENRLRPPRGENGDGRGIVDLRGGIQEKVQVIQTTLRWIIGRGLWPCSSCADAGRLDHRAFLHLGASSFSLAKFRVSGSVRLMAL